jgi:hypothetical protein
MTELIVRVDIGVSRGAVRAAIAGLLLSGMAAELASESLSMNTYFPPKNGVYSQVVTSGYAILARDGGSVAIRSLTNPTTSKLFVNGGIGGTSTLTSSGQTTATNTIMLTASHAVLKSDQGGSIELGADNDRANPVAGGAPYIDFHYGTGSAQDYNVRIQNAGDSLLSFYTSASATPALSVNGAKVGINNASPGATFDVNGSVISASGANCRAVNYTRMTAAGGACAALAATCAGDNPCLASEFITTVGGHLGKYVAVQDGALSATGTTTNGSAVITGLPANVSAYGIVLGDYVTGTGIQSNAIITGLGNGSVTMSLAATATATSVLKFIGSGGVLCCRCPNGVCPSL